MALYATCLLLSSDTFHDKLFPCDQRDDAEYHHDHEEGLPVARSVQVFRPISALPLAKIIRPEYWDSKRHWRLFWTNARNTGCRNMMVRWSTHSEA